MGWRVATSLGTYSHLYQSLSPPFQSQLVPLSSRYSPRESHDSLYHRCKRSASFHGKRGRGLVGGEIVLHCNHRQPSRSYRFLSAHQTALSLRSPAQFYCLLCQKPQSSCDPGLLTSRCKSSCQGIGSSIREHIVLHESHSRTSFRAGLVSS